MIAWIAQCPWCDFVKVVGYPFLFWCHARPETFNTTCEICVNDRVWNWQGVDCCDGEK